jgi:hypothetical protein
MAAPIEITLANLAGGGLMECATLELRKICENVSDPNVKADAKRKLVITVMIEPDETRQMAKVTYEVKSSIPGPDAGKTMAYIAMAPGSKTIGLFEVETRLPFEDPPLPFTPLATKQG